MLKTFCSKHILFNSRWFLLAFCSSVVWKLLSEVMSYMRLKYVSIPSTEIQLRGPRHEFWLRWKTSSSELTAEAGGSLNCWDQRLPFCWSHATCGISWKGCNSRLWTKVSPGLRSRISKVEMRFRQPRWDFPHFTLDIYSVNAEGCHLHWHPSATFIDNGENHAVLEHLLPR